MITVINLIINGLILCVMCILNNKLIELAISVYQFKKDPVNNSHVGGRAIDLRTGESHEQVTPLPGEYYSSYFTRFLAIVFTILELWLMYKYKV